jgi:DivIVA domain-containing protein
MAAVPSLSPDLIEKQAFTSGFRGFDQSEVRDFLARVATEVRALRDRANQLESAWHSAEERAARPPVLDEDTLMAAVGEETASILRAARSAAADLRNRAAQDAERIMGEAEARAGEVRAEADAVLVRETQAAEETAGQLIGSARSEAVAIVDKAKADAEGIRASAQQERALTLDGAISTRERILDDLSRRRRVASVQIEQLRAGRERLLESYGVVRRTLEEVNDELNRADAEARAAADEVGRRMQREYHPESPPDDPGTGGPGVGDPGVGEPGAGDSAVVGSADPDPGSAADAGSAGDAAGATPDPPSHATGGVPPEGAHSPPEQETVPTTPVGSSAPGPLASGPGTGGDPPTATAGGSPGRPRGRADSVQALAPIASVPTDEHPAGGIAVPRLRVVTDPSDGSSAAATGSPPVGVLDSPPRPAGPVRADPASTPPAKAGPSGSKVDVLFARIRSSRATKPEQPVAHAESGEDPGGAVAGTVETDPDVEAAPAEATDVAVVADVPDVEAAAAPAEATEAFDGIPTRSDGDEALLQRREAAIVDLESSLTRKLKRTMQDEQNDLLDRLRSLKGTPTAARLLPDLPDQIDRYARAAEPAVDQAASAGVAFAAQTLGLEGSSPEAPEATDLATETATTIVESLRRQLERAVETSADDDQSVLIEALGAAYREWKSERIERVAGDGLTAAFSRGTWHAVPDGTALRWVVDDLGGPCPDCDDDALAGALPKGEPFPTGQAHPPAHTGCRCLLVPSAG